MDVNGTHFQVLLGYDDWANCSATENGTNLLRQVWKNFSSIDGATGSAWDNERSELILHPSRLQITTPLTHTPPQLKDRRGAGRDRYGNWYWIDISGNELLVNSVGTGHTTHFWSLADGIDRGSQANGGYFQPRPEEVQPLPDPLPLSGLTVTEDHYLVVGVLQPAGILVFDLYAGGPPQLIVWPREVPFMPFDMAAMPGGGVWILDREHARYWALDRHFHVITREQQELLLAPEQSDIFQPTDDAGMPLPGAQRRTAARSFPGGIVLNAASPIGVYDTVAIEALPDGTVLILDSDPHEPCSFIYRYLFAQQLGPAVPTGETNTPDNVPGFCARGYDFAFVPEHDEDGHTKQDRLYIVPLEGNQVYAFDIWQQDNQLNLRLLPNFFPMRIFGGKGLVAAGDQAYYDFADMWVPVVEQRRPRYATEAILYTPLGKPRQALDGQLPNCVWHRLILDACIPAETMIQIRSRAADDEVTLRSAPWQAEPPLYLRGDGSELPFAEKVTGEGNGTWELLFQAARGRYLQLEITLTGNGRSTPRLRAMRIYYPRFSYLEHYLPAVYREDDRSASFLDRFLANLEGFYTPIEDKIAAVQMLFDPRSAPSEALDWLANWFGIALDRTWDTNRRRLFLQHAMEFFQYRGTICGLLMVLRLTFDPCPDKTIFTDCLASRAHIGGVRIVERFRARQASARPRWSPAQGGRSALVQQYRLALEQHGFDAEHVNSVPLIAPEDVHVQSIWKQFVQDTLSFVPSMDDADLPAWQAFLERRYEKIENLNRAYQENYSAFDNVPLAKTLPPDGPALLDWYQFQAIVLAMRNAAHQFTVLLPVPGNAEDYQHQLELAQRIIELEKPVHTVFEVKFYLAVFRIGVARLGVDSFVDLGSRTPQLMAPMILGQSSLLESYLASEQTLDVTHRAVLKREQAS